MKHHCPGWGPRVRMAVLLMAAWILPWHVSTSRAESAQVLPKGVSSASATYYHYFDITERYDPNGKVEDIDANYNANLNSTVFPALAPEDVQRLLGAGLDVNGDGTVDVPGFGYKRFESFKGNGVGDIDLLAKYKFHEDSQWRLA